METPSSRIPEIQRVTVAGVLENDADLSHISHPPVGHEVRQQICGLWDKQANVSAVSSFEDRVVVLVLRFGEFIGLDSGGSSISGSFGGPLRFGESLFHVSGLQIGGSSLALHDRVLRSNDRVLLRRDAQLVSNDSSLKHTDQRREPAEPSSESSVFRAPVVLLLSGRRPHHFSGLALDLDDQRRLRGCREDRRRVGLARLRAGELIVFVTEQAHKSRAMRSALRARRRNARKPKKFQAFTSLMDRLLLSLSLV